MTHFESFVGIDISKDRLDVYCHPQATKFCLSNSHAGFSRLLQRLGKRNWVVGCEATGVYESGLLTALSERGRPGYCLHPADIRAFARPRGAVPSSPMTSCPLGE